MRLPFRLEPRDLLVATVSIVGWAATAAYWTATTHAAIESQARMLQEHAATLATHTSAIGENSTWHAALAAHADSDRRELSDHEARLRAVEDRIAMIPVMANDVAWIKAHLSKEDRR